jgi:2-hydroxychromene-2-carboxylate isomerase
VPLVIRPKAFPLDTTPAACLICAAPEAQRMALAGELLAALWKDDRNTADLAVLKEIGSRHGVTQGDRASFDSFTQEALARGVFGAPSYVYRDEIFWGQDRLEFLERALAQ